MKLTIIINETTPFDPLDYDNGLLNGSEEMMVLFARELSTTYEEVTVYCSLTSGRCTDVHFEGGNIINYYDRSYLGSHLHRGTLIAFKDQSALMIHGFDRKFLWTADANILNASERRQCNGLVGISKWHMRELRGLNVGYRHTSYIEPGVIVNPSEEERVHRQCIYASSPDRGLKFLQEIWPEVKIKVPDASLICTYTSDKRLTNEEMDHLYKTSDVLAYPCSGQERYCLTAIKAQLYGTIPCVIPNMALQDTVQFGDKCLKKDYVSTIIALLLNDSRRANIRSDMKDNVRFNTWEQVVAQWEALIG